MRWTQSAAMAVFLLMVIADGMLMPLEIHAQNTQSPLEPYRETVLDNGLRVIVKEVHTAPIVAVYLWCDTGSINERPDEHGISHFYEHMFFKGTEKRGVGDIDRAIKSIGGYNNAFTSKEYTAYYVVLPSENFSLAADVLVDAIRNSKLPEDEIEKELGVIHEEINRKEDDPSGKLYEEIFKLTFPDTPYAHPVLGTKETVSAITRDDFIEYINRYYVPNNMAAVIVGDVDPERATDEIRRLTKDWRPDPDVSARKVDVNIPRANGVREMIIEKDVNMSYVIMAFQADGYSDLDETTSLDIASSILGEGRSSRLYRRLVENERIANSVQAFIYPLTHAGLFVVYGTMAPEKVEAFRTAVLEEAGRLGNELIGDAELDKVKTMLKADYQFSNETDSDLANSLGHYAVLDMLEYAVDYEQIIDSVDAEQVRTHARNALDPENYTIGVMNPRTDSAGEVQGE